MNECFLFDAIRTPRGRASSNGALAGVPPLRLLEGLYREAARRHPALPDAIDGAVIGCVTQTGEQGGNIGQTAMLAADWRDAGSATMVNSFCTSGLVAAGIAASRVRLGESSLMAIGGVESMSRVPLMSDGGPLTSDPVVARAIPFVPNPIIADYVATVEGLGRDTLDAYAVASHAKAAAAADEGRFARSLIPVLADDGSVILDRDEAVRPNCSMESLARLRPLVDADKARWANGELLRHHGGIGPVIHLHHAGSAPAMVDGASLAILGSLEAGAAAGLEPRARLVASSTASGPATLGLSGGAAAARDVLRRAAMSADDIDLWEFNEGFAAVALAFACSLGVPAERLNVNGGGIAMGHAMGATGVNLVSILIDELERQDLRTGLIAISGATGIGGAIILERCG